MERVVVLSWIHRPSMSRLLLVLMGSCAGIGLAGRAGATPPPVKPIDVAASAFRGCQTAFNSAKDIKVETTRNERIESALRLCGAAERMQHSVEHLIWLARIYKARGRIAEAREFWGRVAVETSDDSPAIEKEWRAEASRQLAPFFVNAAITGVARPETAIDLGRLSNPALPEDLVFPSIQSCANAATVTGKHLAGRIDVELGLSERGEILQLSISLLPANPRGDDEPLSPAFVSCVTEGLRNVVVPREAGAQQIFLKGQFMVVLGESDFNPGQTEWVRGRMHEVSP